MAETIVRLYDDISEAYQVVDELVQTGFDREDITLMAYDPEGTYADYVDVDYEQVQDVGEEAAVGAGVGAIIGGLGGLLVGLGALTIPGVGPIIAAGPIAAALIGAGTGATVGGLVGALVETGVPEETAQYYAEGVRRGGTLVVLRTRADLVQRAEGVFERHQAVNMEQRATSWQNRGWQADQMESEPYTRDQIEYEADYYNTYDPTFRQHYQANYSTSGYPYARYEPAYHYGYDLATKRDYEGRDWAEVEPQARREWERQSRKSAWDEVKDAVEQGWNEVKNALDFDQERDYQTREQSYRTHHAAIYTETGMDYEQYEPAYRYGYDMAYDERYMDRDWDEIEPDARRDWERDNPDSAWENVKDAVQSAWSEVQEAFDFDEEEDYRTYDETFRTHYTGTYGTAGREYDYYEPAYRYGYALAYDDRYMDRDWDEIEPEVRREWESENPDTVWENVKDAIENAWNEVQTTFDFEEDYQTYDEGFRTHYTATYGTTAGRTYNEYEPAYRYGYDMAYDERYQNRDWNEIEPEARREWEQENPGSAWENVKDAVENAWSEVQNTFDFEEDYQSHDQNFRTHYTGAYGTTGRDYDYYEPAYRYGHSLAYDERYADRQWTEIEPDARREWETEYGQNTWENVKDAVQNAWNDVLNALDFDDESDVNIEDDYQQYEDYHHYNDRFRNHYNTTYGTTGYNYDYYEPAYRYGYDLATSERYGRHEWGEIETEARDLWEGRNEGTWDRFKDAVEHAWHEVKEGLGMTEEGRTSRTTQPRQFS